MKVFIVFHYYSNEGKDVEGVFLNKANAYAFAEKRNKRLNKSYPLNEWYNVDMFDVDDATSIGEKE